MNSGKITPLINSIPKQHMINKFLEKSEGMSGSISSQSRIDRLKKLKDNYNVYIMENQ